MSFNHLLAFLKTSLEFGGEESFNEVWNMRDEVNVYCSQACLYNHGNNCQLNMISGKLCSAWESHVCIWAPFPPWILSPTSLLSTPPPPQNQTSQMVHRLYNGWNSCNDNISMKCHRGLSHNMCKDRRSLWITTTCPIKKTTQALHHSRKASYHFFFFGSYLTSWFTCLFVGIHCLGISITIAALALLLFYDSFFHMLLFLLSWGFIVFAIAPPSWNNETDNSIGLN